MGLDLAAGGHLTHGSPVNLSGSWFKPVSYTVRKDDNRIDMEQVAALAKEHKPKIIIAGGSGYSRIWDFEAFRKIADSVGAYFMVDMAHFAGLVAAGLHPSPFPHAHVVTTTTHKTLRGPRGGMVLTNDEDIAKKINSAVFPGLQGGPLMHVIAGKAVAFGEALKPEFKAYQQQVKDNARVLAETLVAAGFAIVSGGTDNHLMLVDLRPEENHGQGGGGGAGPRPHHLQQERHSLRPREALRHLGHSSGIAGRDLARLWRRGVQAGRRLHRGSAGRPRRQWRSRQRRDGSGGEGEGSRADGEVPDLLSGIVPLARPLSPQGRGGAL